VKARLVRLPVADVILGERHRTDLGDLQGLADSIVAVGLLHPIVVDDQHRLVAGHRRYEAWRLLHGAREPIPAHVVDTVDSALLRVRAERDENVCRKDFTPSEAVALGLALEAIEKPKAKANSAANLPTAQVAHSEPVGRVTARVAPATGLSPRTYEKAKAVVAAAQDKNLPDEVREVAREAVVEMDRSGKVDGAFKKVAAAQGDPVGEFLDSSQDVQDARYLHNLLKDLVRASDVWKFDPARVGRIADAELVETIETHVARANRWLDQMRTARRGLRVVGGKS